MDTSARRRRAHLTIEYFHQNSEYVHDLSVYKSLPTDNIALEEFEDCAIERLQLLRILEEASLKGHRLYSEDWKKYIKEELAKHGLRRYLRLLGGYNSQTELDFQARKYDYISHFILRLAYCRSEDLRRWFLSRELEWFRLRFLVQTQQGILKFLELNNLTYVPIPCDVKENLRDKLISGTAGVSERDFDSTEFYKVHFTEVPSLVRNRKVFLEKGFSYIPTSELIVCIQSKFRAHLNEALHVYNQRMGNMDDERLSNLLNNLHHVHTGNTYTFEENKEGIHLSSLDAYAKKNFPMCMQHLYNLLKTNHHLKHQSRLQLLLFLKGIGLSYEDTMTFWRTEFTKNPQIDENKFDKQYSYTVRHSFGKAGGMTNYSPYSCIKIITGTLGTGDNHGCPFKHWDATILKNKLEGSGMGSSNISAVMDLVKGGHAQIACTKYFECSQGQASTVTINHPNQYFSESVNLSKEKPGTKKN